MFNRDEIINVILIKNPNNPEQVKVKFIEDDGDFIVGIL